MRILEMSAKEALRNLKRSLWLGYRNALMVLD